MTTASDDGNPSLLDDDDEMTTCFPFPLVSVVEPDNSFSFFVSTEKAERTVKRDECNVEIGFSLKEEEVEVEGAGEGETKRR